MKKILLLNYILLSITSLLAQKAIYKNPSYDPEDRTKDLISRMTLEEKVGQLLCPLGWEMYEKKNDNKISHSKKFEQYIQEKHIGMLWATFRADPWTQKTIENGLNPTLAAKVANTLQKYAIENTRLGIPIFLAEECPHGHMAIGTTVFPTAIGQASTWNPDLVAQMSKTIAQEARIQGAHIGYGPVLDLAREPRWSRTEETYGEDPILVSKMGEAFVTGFGQGKLSSPNSLISTLKHFTAYGIPEGGHNGNTPNVGTRDLHENYLLPFQKAIQAGALSVMTAYNSINGVPCTTNKYLLKEVLKTNWKFNGFVVSDLGSIEGLNSSHHIVENTYEAAILALSSGLDCDLGGNAFTNIIEAVKNNRIGEETLNKSVSHILKLKFEMGLFEKPYVDTINVSQKVKINKHIELARKVAQESIVLLKNENNTLPLKKSIKKIAVIGPNANNIYNQLGDYTAPQINDNIKTVLDGIRSKIGNNTQIEYVKGCAIRDTNNLEIDKAVQIAYNSDINIVVVGGSSARDFKTKYINTGAAIVSDYLSDMESGEGYDRATLSLMGKQQILLEAIKKTGKPMVVIYIAGRPLNMNWANQNAEALLMAWYPGQEGGNAIADVLFGDYVPAGRLPISIPKSVGQLPVYYNKKNPESHNYIEMSHKPLFSFGYGLSYTSFDYSDLKITKVNTFEYEVTFIIQNTGAYDGDEVAQLYIKDLVASTVRPTKQLKHFKRIHIKKGKAQNIKFTLNKEDFSLLNLQMKTVVEPGTFKIMIGSSSDSIKLKGEIVI